MSTKKRKKRASPPSGAKGGNSAAGRRIPQAVRTAGGADWFLTAHPAAVIWLSALLPVVGLLVIYACMGIYPFGEKSVANVDMIQQYIPFYASLKHAVFGGQGLDYSQSLGMGSSYWGLIGYYLTSPFAALSLLVPNDRLTDYMAVQELARIGLTGASFGFFYSRKFGRKDLTVSLFSLCYALSTFMLVHLCTVIWGGCLTLLPLIVWGLEELLRGKKPWLYVLCLSLAGISNYYIALMIGIYLVLYAAGFLFSEGFFTDRRVLLRKAGMFAACSLLSVGAAAGILLPSALLLGEYGGGAAEGIGGFFTMNPLRLLSQMLYAPDCRILHEDALPLTYCTVLAVLLLPLFFLSREISRRVKAALGGVAGFLLLSLAVEPLSYLWHGARHTNSLPYRFSFLLVFTVLVMAGYVVKHFASLSQNAFNVSLFAVMAVAAVSYFTGVGAEIAMFAVTMAAAVCYTVLFYLRAGSRLSSSGAEAVALLMVFAETVSCGVLAWRGLEKESPYPSREEYILHDRRIEAAGKKLAVSDGDLYRVGTLTEGAFNNNALIGQGGMSCFSSTNSYPLMKLLNRLGCNSDEKVTYYQKSFTPLSDSMLNVRYVIYNEDAGNPPYLQRVGEADGYYLYRNTLALPRAFPVSDSLTEWNIEQDDPFDVQNDLIRLAVSDSDLTVYEKQPLSVAGDSFHSSYDGGSVQISPHGSLLLTGTSSGRRHLYVYFLCRKADAITLIVGKNQFNCFENDFYIADLGWVEAGETFAIAVRAGETEVSGRVSAAFLNENALEKGVGRLRERASRSETVSLSENRLVCRVSAEKGELLFTSIPYEKGWRVRVNGKAAEAVPIGGGLIGVPLAEGDNTVEMIYTVRGRTLGIVISLLCIAALVWLLFGKELKTVMRRFVLRKLQRNLKKPKKHPNNLAHCT